MSVDTLPGPPGAQRVQLHVEGPVATLTLDRDEVRNALDPQLIDELTALLEWSAAVSVAATGMLCDGAGTETLRVVVLAAAGRAFCAGADIGWMRAMGGQDKVDNLRDAERLDRLYRALDTHPCLTIARVQGSAFGGGVGLVAACDVVLATRQARFAFSEAKLGILPAVIAPFVMRRLGQGHARRHFMLAGRFTAAEALRVGLVDDVLDSSGQIDQRVAEVCAEVLTTAPGAVAAAKRLVTDVVAGSHDPDHLRSDNVALTARMRGGPEGQEGLGAFLERRDPAWSRSWPPATDSSEHLWTAQTVSEPETVIDGWVRRASGDA